MDTLLFLAFVTTTLLFVAVPGPSVAFASAQAVRHGAKAAAITVAGDALGTVVHICIAVWGLATLIAISETVLPFLQIVGGVFIIYMSIQSFRSSRHPAKAPVATNHRVTFWAGFFACVTNPKAIVFFVALFPSFISPEHNILLQSLIYGTIFLFLDAISILGYALLAMHAVRKATSRWLNIEALSGLGLFGVGFGMIVKGYRSIPSN
ncbi:LysE family translocator [Ruegeria sp. EL01]|jgi:threonine/homoserine/homoserine lactone efflux protein|uniref:LysE family translocator n=1 Tax=Ruegeria sp. EL01 TaxID=2107578 RepID=UPI000EA7F53B|nr:LysE family translocator [Ruegeria sp. EL01]